MNNLIMIGVLLLSQGECNSIKKYSCITSHVDNEIIISIKNDEIYEKELIYYLENYPLIKIDRCLNKKDDKFLFYKITLETFDDNLLHYYLDRIKDINIIETASLNYYLEYEGTNVTNDPYIDNQYYFDMILSNHCWNVGNAENPILVGIIDTGIDGNHPDLQKNINKELSHDFSGGFNSINSEPLVDYVGHGTQVAGIIGATSNNGIGIKGIIQNVSLVSLKISNVISEAGVVYNAIEAISYANINNIKILNLSWTFPQEGNDSFKKAIENYDGLIICASGNDYKDIDNESITNRYPSHFTNNKIISVGATDCHDNKTNYSNYGIKSVDLFAPGHHIYTTNSTSLYNENTYTYVDGTSFAAPMVTGVSALLSSINPSLTPIEIKNIILDNVDNIESLKNMCVTGGRLNAYNVLSKYHIHNYSYDYNNDSHTYACSCGNIEESSSHLFKVSYNTKTHTYECKCGYKKIFNHNFKFEYIDNKCHGDNCICGYYENTSPHIIKQSSISNNKAVCLECNHILDLKYDFAFTDGTFDIVYITLDGSYKLPNGIILLTDSDYQKYIDGLLFFKEKDNLIN